MFAKALISQAGQRRKKKCRSVVVFATATPSEVRTSHLSLVIRDAFLSLRYIKKECVHGVAPRRGYPNFSRLFRCHLLNQIHKGRINSLEPGNKSVGMFCVTSTAFMLKSAKSTSSNIYDLFNSLSSQWEFGEQVQVNCTRNV